jgi:hypothetical protein
MKLSERKIPLIPAVLVALGWAFIQNELLALVPRMGGWFTRLFIVALPLALAIAVYEFGPSQIKEKIDQWFLDREDRQGQRQAWIALIVAGVVLYIGGVAHYYPIPKLKGRGAVTGAMPTAAPHTAIQFPLPESLPPPEASTRELPKAKPAADTQWLPPDIPIQDAENFSGLMPVKSVMEYDAAAYADVPPPSPPGQPLIVDAVPPPVVTGVRAGVGEAVPAAPTGPRLSLLGVGP